MIMLLDFGFCEFLICDVCVFDDFEQIEKYMEFAVVL